MSLFKIQLYFSHFAEISTQMPILDPFWLQSVIYSI